MPFDPHIMFAGGGNPGHISAGIAVANQLRGLLPASEITFAGAGRVADRHRVRAAGYHYTSLPASRTPERPLEALRFAADNVLGFCAARWSIREQDVSLVVGLGGTSSTAVCRAALGRGLPVVVIERNAVPERATRLLSTTAATICLAYEEAVPHLHIDSDSLVTGAPSRPSFHSLYEKRASGEHFGRLMGTRRLLVMGGVDGARSLNESVPAALAQLGPSASGWQIVHQTGEGQLQETEQRYKKAGVEALVVSYIDEVASVCFASDLVIGRPGGTMLAEMALAGVPAVLVPHNDNRSAEQWANARIYRSAGAAKVIDESAAGETLQAALVRELNTLMTDPNQLSDMSRAMQEVSRPDAAKRIAEVAVEALCGKPATELPMAA